VSVVADVSDDLGSRQAESLSSQTAISFRALEFVVALKRVGRIGVPYALRAAGEVAEECEDGKRAEGLRLQGMDHPATSAYLRPVMDRTKSWFPRSFSDSQLHFQRCPPWTIVVQEPLSLLEPARRV
jgi:hypothetical protein